MNKENLKLKFKCSVNICCKKGICMFCINIYLKKMGVVGFSLKLGLKFWL